MKWVAAVLVSVCRTDSGLWSLVLQPPEPSKVHSLTSSQSLDTDHRPGPVQGHSLSQHDLTGRLIGTCSVQQQELQRLSSWIRTQRQSQYVVMWERFSPPRHDEENKHTLSVSVCLGVSLPAAVQDVPGVSPLQFLQLIGRQLGAAVGQRAEGSIRQEDGQQHGRRAHAQCTPVCPSAAHTHSLINI